MSLFPAICWGQKINNYSLSFDKRYSEAANMRVICSFIIDFQDADSICMNLGGPFELSVDDLIVYGNTSLKYDYRKENKQIIYYRPSVQKVAISMEYNYTNLTSFFVYGKGDAELWETSYEEYYYPYIPDINMSLSVKVSLPDSLSLISSYAMHKDSLNNYSCRINNVLAQSLSLAFIRKEVYMKTTATIPESVQIYQIRNMQCKEERYNELLTLISESIRYFSRIYKDNYLSESHSITSYPIFLFHNGEGFSNRYNIGFISASQEKFSTYPNIYPLVHEIGHRWLGEWTLLINDGQAGAYFIKESLNEFMTLMFIRDYFGEKTYKDLIDQYKEEYQKIKNSKDDVPLIDITENNNNTVVYRKGPLVLDYIAKEIGYDRLIASITLFYQQYNRKIHLCYEDFIDTLARQYPEAGKDLDTMVRNK